MEDASDCTGVCKLLKDIKINSIKTKRKDVWEGLPEKVCNCSANAQEKLVSLNPAFEGPVVHALLAQCAIDNSIERRVGPIDLGFEIGDFNGIKSNRLAAVVGDAYLTLHVCRAMYAQPNCQPGDIQRARTQLTQNDTLAQKFDTLFGTIPVLVHNVGYPYAGLRGLSVVQKATYIESLIGMLILTDLEPLAIWLLEHLFGI